MQRLLAVSLCLVIVLSACLPSFGQQTDAGNQDSTTGDTGGETKDTAGDTAGDTSGDTAEVTQDPVAEPAATATSTPRPEPTNTPGPPWAGNWVIASYGYDTAGYPLAWHDGPMTCTEGGYEWDVTCEFTGWGAPFKLNGNISDDGVELIGRLAKLTTGETWQIRFRKLNANQFYGSWYYISNPQSDGIFCGARGGAPMPDQCDH